MITESPQTPTIGSELRGIDVRRLDENSFKLISDIFYRRGVIFIPEQNLSADELLNFAMRFGEPWLGPLLKPSENSSSVVTITNRGKDKTATEYWHSDTTFVNYPPAITLLSAVDVPKFGGDTMWCDQYGLYESLSEGFQKLLSNLAAVHYDRQRFNVLPGRTPSMESAVHPLVRIHPVTKRKSLFISGQAEHFQGMTREESRPLLSQLLGLLGQPDFVYRHRWKKGDLLMWDNRSTTHYAIHDYGDYPRRLHRVTVQGEHSI